MNRYENQLIFEIPALGHIQQRLDAIEKALEKLTSVIEMKEFKRSSNLPEKKMMNLNEISKAYGMSIWSLRYRASRREIPLTRIGRRLYVNIEDFEKWLAEKKIEAIE